MGRKLNPIEEGTRFGRLKFVRDLRTVRVAEHRTIRIGLFSCDCGNEKELAVHNVVNGKTKSCGCIRNIKSGVVNPTTERKVKTHLVEEGFFDVDAFFRSDFILQA